MKKVHLVKWYTNSKEKGGVGIKKISLMNEALLLKGWGRFAIEKGDKTEWCLQKPSISKNPLSFVFSKPLQLFHCQLGFFCFLGNAKWPGSFRAHLGHIQATPLTAVSYADSWG